MFNKTGVTLHEVMPFKIQESSDYAKVQDDCEKCKQELDEIYDRGAEDYDLIVLKCPKCKTIYAYLVDKSNDLRCGTNWEGDNKPSDHSGPVASNLKEAFPKNCVTAYGKTLTSLEAKNTELSRIINAKLSELYKIGLSLTTINLARSTLAHEINADTTTNQLKVLIAAAIYARANNTNTNGGLWHHKGEGATERQLEEIFGVSRKTIRKWAEKFNDKLLKGATD